MDFHDVARLVTVGKVTQVELAGKLGLSLSQVHDRLSGQVPFRPNEIRTLLQAVADARLAKWLLEGTPFTVAERPQPETGAEQLLDQALESLFSIVQTIMTVHQALEDKRVDHQDRRKILEAVSAAETELATLKHLVA